MRFDPKAARDSIAPGVVTGEQLAELILATLDELQRDVQTLESRCVEAATTDRDYRSRKSVEYLATEGTVAEREAKVLLEVGDLRFRAHLAESMRVAAIEAVRTRRAKLSALQSLVKASIVDWELAKATSL